MVENILSNTTKLVSLFLDLKYIFYKFYNFMGCCCALTEPFGELPDNPLGRMCVVGVFRWDECVFEWTIREIDRPSIKTTNSTSVKMSGAILEASGLRIERGLFLWSSSDVGDLF